MKKILVVTSSRADYFLLRPLLIKLKAIKEFQLEIIATGSHHLKSHGYTMKEIERELARLEILVESLSYTEMRVVAQLESGGGEPGPEASVLKVEHTEIMQRITELAMTALGPYGAILERDRPIDGGRFSDHAGDITSDMLPIVPRYLNFRAATIYGGSNEVQRNIIAKTALHLP